MSWCWYRDVGHAVNHLCNAKHRREGATVCEGSTADGRIVNVSEQTLRLRCAADSAAVTGGSLRSATAHLPFGR